MSNYPYRDTREQTFKAVLQVINTPYYPFKLTRLLRLVQLLGDEHLNNDLKKSMKEIELRYQMTVYDLDTILNGSDSLNNFIKVKGKRITDFQIQKDLVSVETIISEHLSRIQKNIRFSGV